MQAFERKRPGKRPGVPNFKAISKKPDFDRCIAVVITMGDRIDNRFAVMASGGSS